MKEKIVEALNCSLYDLSEDKLIDLLIDALKQSKKDIARISDENLHERTLLEIDRRQFNEEMKRVRCDPLYSAGGHYVFQGTTSLISVNINGTRIEVYEQKGKIDYVCEQVMS